MSLMMRAILIVGSILSLGGVILSIRKSKVRIEDSVFWFCFSAILVVMGLFPGIVTFFADVIGVQSPVNLVFLAVIFVLIVKLFRMSIRISQLESKIQTLAQRYALDHAGNSGERHDER